MLNEGVAEIYLYGYVGYPEDGGQSSFSFVSELNRLAGTCAQINLRINSPGGGVYEGIGIYNAMERSRCPIDTYCDGIAASMASVLFLAGRKRYISKYGQIMTHKPSGGAWGTADEMRKCADDIDNCERIVTDMMVAKMGITAAVVSEKYLNGKDNYFGAEAAKTLKLADDIYDAPLLAFPEQMSLTGGVQAAWNAYSHLQPQPNTQTLIVI